MKSTRESIRFLGPGLKSVIKKVTIFYVCMFDLGFVVFIVAVPPPPPSLTSFQKWEECEKHKGKHKVFRFRFDLTSACLFVGLSGLQQLRCCFHCRHRHRRCCCSKDGKSVKSTRESIRFLGSSLNQHAVCLFVCLFVFSFVVVLSSPRCRCC